MIAWRILTTGEPYRYAQPAATVTKLVSLRIAATCEKRRGGSPRGEKAAAKLPGGSKTIRSQDDTYQNEGLPTRSPLPPEPDLSAANLIWTRSVPAPGLRTWLGSGTVITSN